MQQQTRRIRRRRSIALAAVAMLAAGSTAACSTGSEPKKTPASKELVYWSMWQQAEPQAKVIQKALDSFSKETGVAVTVQWKGRTVLTDMADAMKTGAAAPDLVDGSINTVTASLVAPGHALDLTALYSQQVPGENSLLSDVVPDKYLPMLSDQNNRAVMVPYEVATEAFFFDKVKQSQLAGGGKPQTWAQFTQVLAVIKAAGKTPPLALDPIAGNCAFWTDWVLERELGPGQLKKAAEEKTGSLNGAASRWDDPLVLDGAQKLEALVKAGYFAPGYATEDVGANSTHSKDQQNKWASGGTAMILGGTWTPSETATTLADNAKNVDAFIFPSIPGTDGIKGDNSASVNFFGFAVPRDGLHPDAAQRFILYFMNKDRLSGISTVADNMTPRPDIPAPQALLSVQQALTNRTVFPDQDGLMRDDAPWFQKVFQPASVDLMTGKITAKEFVARVKSQSAAFWASPGS